MERTELRRWAIEQAIKTDGDVIKNAQGILYFASKEEPTIEQITSEVLAILVNAGKIKDSEVGSLKMSILPAFIDKYGKNV